MSLSKFHDPLGSIAHPQFEPEIKRAILESWACDTPPTAFSADSSPLLRKARRDRLYPIASKPEHPRRREA